MIFLTKEKKLMLSLARYISSPAFILINQLSASFLRLNPLFKAIISSILLSIYFRDYILLDINYKAFLQEKY